MAVSGWTELPSVAEQATGFFHKLGLVQSALFSNELTFYRN